MATNPDDIQLSPEQKERIAELADKSGRPWPEVLQGVLMPAESLYEKVKRTGAIGMIDGGPTDTSTNKKYFDSFGRD